VNANYIQAVVQQVVFPAAVTAHAIVNPSLMEMKVPDGGANRGSGQELTMVPSAFGR
jgi:hypothetical protein